MEAGTFIDSEGRFYFILIVTV